MRIALPQSSQVDATSRDRDLHLDDVDIAAKILLAVASALPADSDAMATRLDSG